MTKISLYTSRYRYHQLELVLGQLLKPKNVDPYWPSQPFESRTKLRSLGRFEEYSLHIGWRKLLSPI